MLDNWLPSIAIRSYPTRSLLILCILCTSSFIFPVIDISIKKWHWHHSVTMDLQHSL